MAKGLITRAYLKDTADAIRVLRGESNTYTPDEFGEKIIDAIPTEEVTGSVVSISDAAAYPAEGLEFAIEPVQDLHGYDKPWPAGGGKNLINAPDITLADAGVIYSGTINLPAGTYTLSSSNTTTSVTVEGTSGVMPLTFTLATAITSIEIATSAAGTFNNIQVESGSTATSYEPYANICPISGWTGVNGERTGKNLYFDKLESASINAYGKFENNYSNDVYIARVKENEKYTFTTNESGVTVGGYFTEKPSLSSTTYNGARLYISQNTPLTVIIPQGVKYIAIRYLKTFTNYVIELGSTATTYEPYQGASIPITFPTEAGTVYGGKADVINGKLLAYPEYDSYNGETLTGEWLSSMDAYAEGTTPTIGAQVVDLSGVGTEYDITPQQVQMLLGDNNIWCDTGDTTLEYKVDLSRFIAKLQASQTTPQLSLSRQAVSLDEEPRDVEPISVEVRTDETPTADTTEDDEEKGGEND